MRLRVSHLDPAQVAAVVVHCHLRDRQIRADDLFFFAFDGLLMFIVDWLMQVVVEHVVPSDADGDVRQIFLAHESFAEEPRRLADIGKLISR